MKKITSILLLWICIGSSTLCAQSDKLMPHFGFMYEIVNLDSGSLRDIYPFYTLHLGTYYTLAHKNDFVSVGVDGSAHLGIQFFGSSVNWFVQTPVFLMGRIGANSTYYNEQQLGIGLGIGATATYMNMKGFFDFQGRDIPFRPLFLNPSVILEGTLNTRGGPVTGRIHFSLGGPTRDGVIVEEFRRYYEARKVKYTNWGLGLIYAF